MFCSKCGAQNDDNRNFCTSCGAPLGNANAIPVQPQAPFAAPTVPGKGLGIASMVLGIISLVLFCIWYISVPCAIIAMALGGVAVSKAKSVGASNGMAVAGITTSCVAIGLLLIFFVLAIIGLAELNSMF